jgi:O-methyltransferase involved in polyketide biosynthesis
MIAGQFETFAQRKAFCERQAREGIGSGVSQVLVLGAGYDTRGWRLAPEFPDVNFFEIAPPSTAAPKARGERI